MKISSSCLFKSTGILVLALLAPANAARAQDEEPSVIRSMTRLVQLNVTVLDKQHHAMSGLSQGDFQVFDNGIEQKIVHFSTNSGTAPPRKLSRLAISNRPAGGEELAGVTVIVLDETLLDAGAGVSLDLVAPIRSARLAILKFLSGLRPGEQVGLYSLRSQGVVVIHDFTDDPSALIAAAKSLGTEGAGNPRPTTSMSADWQVAPCATGRRGSTADPSYIRVMRKRAKRCSEADFSRSLSICVACRDGRTWYGFRPHFPSAVGISRECPVRGMRNLFASRALTIQPRALSIRRLRAITTS